MSTMLAVPAALVADVRSGLFGEWGFAAEDLTNLALAFGARGSVDVYQDALKAFDAARDFLDIVGWQVKPKEQAVEIDLELHPLVVLKALHTSQDALTDRLGEVSGTVVPAEVQHEMILRADTLGDFAAAVDAQVRKLGYKVPEDVGSEQRPPHNKLSPRIGRRPS
jgi:hypothetical protein